MWKPLLALAAVLLLGSAALSWVNSQTLKDVRESVMDRSTQVDKRETTQEGLESKLTKTTDDTAEMVKDADDFATQASTLDEEVVTLEEAIEGKKTTLEDQQAELEELQSVIETAEAAEELRSEYDGKLAEAASWRAQVASLESQRNSIQAQISSLDDQTQAARERLEDMKKGNVAPTFASRVKTAYPEWGFVVLSGGVANGVLPKARLAVVRGGEQIAILKVTNAERNLAVAEIVSGSMVPGSTISPGDQVVAAPQEETAEGDQFPSDG